jgi:hypothetical protein
MPNVPVQDGGGRGGGGFGGVDPFLVIQPTSPLNLGNITIAAPTDFVVTLKNGGNGSITLFSINFSDPQFSVVSALPLTFATSHALTLRITPVGAGAKTCNLTFNNDGSFSQVHYVVNANAVDPAAQGIPKIVMLDPTLPIGQMPTAKVDNTSTTSIGVKNVGGVAFNVTGATITAGGTFFALTPPVALPVTLNPGDVVYFPVVFSPNDIGVFTGNLRFTTDLLAPLNQLNVALSGLSVPFFSVSVLDNANRMILFGFDGELKFPETNIYNYANGDSVLEFNGALWQGHGQEKTIERLEVLYENIGVCTGLKCELIALRPSVDPDHYDAVSKTISIGTVLADSSDRSAYFDLTASGEILLLRLTRLSNTGPCSLTGVVPHFADRGEKVENV